MSFVENKIAIRKKLVFLMAEINYCTEVCKGHESSDSIKLIARREAAILLLNMEGYEWDDTLCNAYTVTDLGKEYFS